ncbi:hypothetical protein RN001_013499 [Aquatica leii]|uniref:Superoxide dismutase n=1 Tax=Aquatica leii TaxID=1421715 RepID=A0AAN7SDX9_9COLE|nr:hypothetical protein RN001_013499 [Aquatica leii]
MFAIRRLTSVVQRAQPIRMKHELPPLPYPYEALEPIISRDIMMVHHCKHHQAYITNLNVAEEKLKKAVECNDISTIIALQPALKFNGGGHLNHSIFWKNLSPCKSDPSQDFCTAVQNCFGDINKLISDMSEATIAIQGSGWGWLGYDPKTSSLKIRTCANQDPLKPTTGLIPLLGIDVWEHAYYLQYKNVRADYVKAIFDIINWEDVSKRYREAKSCS